MQLAYAIPQQHAYRSEDDEAGAERKPLGHLRGALDELVDACVLTRPRRNDIGYHIWFAVHGLAVLVGRRALRDASAATHRHLEDVFFTFIGHALA